MTTYYVHIPNSEAPTAEIEASSTKHARTAYLDHLSRNNIITWQQRQQTRRLIKVNRMQPGEIQTQVKLEYGVKEVPVQEIEAPTTDIDAGEFAETPTELSVEPGSELPQERPAEPALQPAQPRRDPLADSPIAKLSRGSMGA